MLGHELIDRLNRLDGVEIFLGVFDDKCRLLYRHCDPLKLSTGMRLEKQIRLDRHELTA